MTILCLAGLAFLLLQRPSLPPSAVVQVAVHYGPQRDTLLSGVVVGDGRQVITDAGVLPRAAEIVVAFTDGEVPDVLMKQVRSHERIGVLALPQKRAAPMPLSPLPVPAEGMNAVAMGSPRSFQVSYAKVQLKPLAPGRWQVTPDLPRFFRGGALIDPQERLLGILIQETVDGPLVGVPLGTVVATLPVVAPLAVVEEKREEPPVPKVEAPPRPAPPREPPAPVLARLALPVPSPAIGWIWKGARPPDTQPAPPPVVEVAAATPPALFVPRPAVVNPTLDPVARSNDLIKARDYDGAIKVLEDASKQFPEQAQLQYHLGFAYWHKAAFKKDGTLRKTMDRTPYRRARQAFETFLKQAPNDPRAPDARVRLDILRRAQFGYSRE